jgi:hypothetical protein
MKKICVVTGTRAEYGLLKPLIRRIKADSELELQLVVTGMHLSPEFGLTYKEIVKDGFEITEKVEMLLSSDTSIGISKSMGLALISFSEVFERIKPHMLIVLGDRYEIFSAASAAMNSRIPIAHLHGGESTEGAVDEAMRHSITKMSYLHFTSNEIYRNRVVQLGEEPTRVFNVGAVAEESIKTLDFISKDKLEEELGMKFDCKLALLTFHPTTLENDSSEDIDGWDATYKMSILARLGMHLNIDCEKLTPVSINIVDHSKVSKDTSIRQVFYLERQGDNSISYYIGPVEIQTNSILGNVKDNFNIIFVDSSSSGLRAYYGRGAGGVETASAMYEDLLDIVKRCYWFEPAKKVECRRIEINETMMTE